MQKIWIDNSFLLKSPTGVGRYYLMILQILKKYNYNDCGMNFKFNIPYKYIIHTLWLNSIFLLKTLILKPDIIISPAFVMPYFTRKKTKYITVIHDLAHLRDCEMRGYNKFIFNLSTKIAIKKATIIIAVSEIIKNELIEMYNVDSNRIKVVYNTIPDYFIGNKSNNELLNKYNIQNKNYILSVATLNKRKNIPELIKAFEKISDKYQDLKLVLVGGMGNEEREKLTKNKSIIFTGYVKDEELPTLYKNALLYMYPSLYEGFGIPLIEAQYLECPVLCSDIPVFREIGTNGVEYCNPTSNCIAAGIEKLINNQKRLNELSTLGKANVKRFSIEKIAEQLNEVLNAK